MRLKGEHSAGEKKRGTKRRKDENVPPAEKEEPESSNAAVKAPKARFHPFLSVTLSPLSHRVLFLGHSPMRSFLPTPA